LLGGLFFAGCAYYSPRKTGTVAECRGDYKFVVRDLGDEEHAGSRCVCLEVRMVIGPSCECREVTQDYEYYTPYSLGVESENFAMGIVETLFIPVAVPASLSCPTPEQ
jgi:hypothetical protein